MPGFNRESNNHTREVKATAQARGYKKSLNFDTSKTILKRPSLLSISRFATVPHTFEVAVRLESRLVARLICRLRNREIIERIRMRNANSMHSAASSASTLAFRDDATDPRDTVHSNGVATVFSDNEFIHNGR